MRQRKGKEEKETEERDSKRKKEEKTWQQQARDRTHYLWATTISSLSLIFPFLLSLLPLCFFFPLSVSLLPVLLMSLLSLWTENFEREEEGFLLEKRKKEKRSRLPSRNNWDSLSLSVCCISLSPSLCSFFLCRNSYSFNNREEKMRKTSSPFLSSGVSSGSYY